MTVDHSTLSPETLEVLVKFFEERQLQIWVSYNKDDRYDMAVALNDMARQAAVSGMQEVSQRYEDVAKFITGSGGHA